MIKNLDDPGIKEKIESETSKPDVNAIHQIIAGVSQPYVINKDTSGLEYHSTTEVKGHPNRCRLKLYHPKENTLIIWFYKRSAVPYSRDRFSYGGVVWADTDKKDFNGITDEVNAWLDWLDSGLHPEKRPKNWSSAFPYDLPD